MLDVHPSPLSNISPSAVLRRVNLPAGGGEILGAEARTLLHLPVRPPQRPGSGRNDQR